MQIKSAKKKVQSLRIIIVGCGKVGHTLTEQLVREGHDITIVDTNERVVRDTTDVFDVMGIQGNGASLSVLKEAGLEEADLVIAVTGSDELNLLCCTIAKKAGGELAAIARVRNPDYSEELSYLRQQLGLSMIINPELEAAQEIARLLSRPQALTVSAFAKGHAELVRFKIPKGSILHGRRVMQLDDIFHFGYLVCAVENEGHVVIPDGSTMLHEGNDITILASSREAHHIFESIGMYQNSVKSCMIIGGGKSSYYLAKQLIEQKMEVKIIESNKERCDVLSTLLPEALVICGDGGDEAVEFQRIHVAGEFPHVPLHVGRKVGGVEHVSIRRLATDQSRHGAAPQALEQFRRGDGLDLLPLGEQSLHIRGKRNAGGADDLTL